jgi:hypothetical protein
VFARTGHFFLIIALLAATGLHWNVLQSLAWTAMLAENLHTTSLHQALEKTFDGHHPCSLCKLVSAGKAAEKKSDFTLQLKKLEYPPTTEKIVLHAPARFQWLSAPDAFAGSLPQRPPTPPPRPFFV